MSPVEAAYRALVDAMPDQEEYDRQIAVVIFSLREMLPAGVTILGGMIRVERSDGMVLTLGPIRNVTAS